VEFVGKNSPNPDKLLYNNDWNNFGPSVGLSWSLPWGGRDKTVLRAGYGIAYQGRFAGGGGLGVDINVGLAPSLNHFSNHSISNLAELNMSNIPMPIPERHPKRCPAGRFSERAEPGLHGVRLQYGDALYSQLQRRTPASSSRGT
jgi:hypothetical protein